MLFDRNWRTVSRFKGKLIQLIKDVNGKFNDYSISPKIRQMLLHCWYELTKKDSFTQKIHWKRFFSLV